MSIERLTFIYDADGSLVGELKYWLGSWIGVAHCALCDITHHKFGRRRSFTACADQFGLPIEYLHRDQLSLALGQLTAGKLPCVVGHAAGGDVILLGGDALESLAGDVSGFETALRVALAVR
ncbi:unannotated protein [freshwater metagenome]|uniref:Unannotated protein n=1 Tax=freshwater metagenome TaxID=449393 RepID=A0A6J7EQP0_9ZZZZ|nr:hypothetical protein [Actinomycetota bacterium]